MKRVLACALGAAALAAGCAVGPDYERPNGAAPAAFVESGPWKEAAPRDTLPKDGWWKVFGDAELDRLEAQAQEGSPDLAASLARVDQARATARIGQSALLPAVALDPSAVRERFSGHRQVQPGSTDLGYTTNSVDVPIDLQYELDVFGRVRRAYESLRALAQAQWADYQTVRLSLQAEVAQDHFALRTLQSERNLLARTLDLRREALDLVRKRRSGGASDDLDVYQAETEMHLVESQVLATDQALARYRHALAVLVGRLPEDAGTAVSPLGGDPPPIPVGLPSDLLERRPDVAEAERNLASASAQIGFAKAAFFPVIGLTAAAGANSAAFDTLLHDNSREWSVGPFVTLPLFEGGANRAGYERAKAAYAEKLALYRRQILVAFQDVEDGLSDLRYLADQSRAIGAAAEDARRAADLSTLRYRQGVADYFEVIDAERTALASEQAATQLEGDRYLATLRLIKALGGGWQN